MAARDGKENIPEGYKQTEIGIIPMYWKMVKLGANSLAQFDYENIGTDTSPDYTFYYITLENIDNGKLIKIMPSKFASASPRARRIVHENDILIATVRPLLHSHYYASNILNNTICSTGFCVISTDKNQLNGKYLYYLFFSNIIDRQIEAIIEGSNYPAINSNDIKKLSIPLPPLPEQHAIAEVLSDMDGYIASLEKLIAKKKAIKQGAMQDLLTGKRRLPGFKGEWEEYRIGDLGYCYSGLTGKSGKDFGIGSARYITFLNVLSNAVINPSVLENVRIADNETQNNVVKGDLFFNTSSETAQEVGMCAALLQELPNTYLNSFCFGFRFHDNSMNSLFLSYLFNCDVGRKIISILAQGATRYNLSKSYFCETKIFVPLYVEQTAIAAVLSDMDTEIEVLTAKLNRAKLVKQGMMQELLTGKIRLVNMLPTQDEFTISDYMVIVAIITKLFTDDGMKFLKHVRYQKLVYLYLVCRKVKTGIFEKWDYGPFSKELAYKIVPRAEQEKAYIATDNDKNICIGENINEAVENAISKGYYTDAEQLAGKIRYRTDTELEVLATVIESIKDLEISRKAISLRSVKEYIGSIPVWEPKLSLEYFTDSAIEKSMKEYYNFFK